MDTLSGSPSRACPQQQCRCHRNALLSPVPHPRLLPPSTCSLHYFLPPAQIVPLCVVLPTAAAAAALLGVWAWRSRRQQAAGKAAQEHLVQGQGGTNGDLEHGAGGRQGGEARGAARGRLGVAGYGARGDGGCVFMGLDDGQTPPEWSEALLREVGPWVRGWLFIGGRAAGFRRPWAGILIEAAQHQLTGRPWCAAPHPAG